MITGDKVTLKTGAVIDLSGKEGERPILAVMSVAKVKTAFS